MVEKLLVNAIELSEMLGISLRKLEMLIAEGDVPKYIRIGRVRKWRVQDVADWIDGKFNVEPAG